MKTQREKWIFPENPDHITFEFWNDLVQLKLATLGYLVKQTSYLSWFVRAGIQEILWKSHRVFSRKKHSASVVKNYPTGDVKVFWYYPISLHFFNFLHIFCPALFFVASTKTIVLVSFTLPCFEVLHNFKAFLQCLRQNKAIKLWKIRKYENHKIRWTHRLGQSLLPREKKLRDEWSKITQKEITMIYCAITNFLPRIILPCIIWKNKLSYNLPKRHSKNNILAFFRTSKSFYKNFYRASWGSTWGMKFVWTDLYIG